MKHKWNINHINHKPPHTFDPLLFAIHFSHFPDWMLEVASAKIYLIKRVKFSWLISAQKGINPKIKYSMGCAHSPVPMCRAQLFIPLSLKNYPGPQQLHLIILAAQKYPKYLNYFGLFAKYFRYLNYLNTVKHLSNLCYGQGKKGRKSPS